MAERPHNKQDIFARVLTHKWAFFACFFLVYFVTYALFFWVGFVPQEPAPEEGTVELVEREASVREGAATYPERIVIDELGIDVAVLNPESDAIAVLDAALLKGAVRHPDSASFREEGNMVIFGHSSYLPQVFNPNFQAFNDVQDLTRGDEIRVRSADTEYTYRVERVYKTKASEASVMLSGGSSMLTIITCNSFGSKDDRFIVEAYLDETRPL